MMLFHVYTEIDSEPRGPSQEGYRNAKRAKPRGLKYISFEAKRAKPRGLLFISFAAKRAKPRGLILFLV